MDPEPPRPHQDGDTWTYTTYILTFFFLTLGVIVTVFGVIIVTIVCVKRFKSRRRRGQKVDPPILSEKEMLEVMKKTGYVNPTYKFYAQS